MLVATFNEKNDFLSELQSVQPKTAALHLFKENNNEFVHMESAFLAKLPTFMRQFFNENHKLHDNDHLQSFFDKKKKKN